LGEEEGCFGYCVEGFGVWGFGGGHFLGCCGVGFVVGFLVGEFLFVGLEEEVERKRWGLTTVLYITILII